MKVKDSLIDIVFFGGAAAFSLFFLISMILKIITFMGSRLQEDIIQAGDYFLAALVLGLIEFIICKNSSRYLG
ncbi:hypothetical protein A2V49_00630 [candidate division WWE3 bacterium RBG_19FT_COMBO_34_6]|uniref:Uncharacterized protein n=1 Tax=candidate division WWE3 bacterium RBG_19FT_COMBO_34_6 TaxID=1802612 RepID=A0A1F4UNJ0_UNCKA|nr:MAG: hypothetical protein A2V49_00630 [candidate division WWE3 bacterium RBG_19FT_COMBO_34_6]